MSDPSVAPHDAPLRDPDNLPVRAPDLMLGRDADIAAVHLALKANQPILLYGAPGSGKSSLAAAVAAERTGSDGGVLWLDLAEDSLRSLLVRVARAYGVALRPDSAQDDQTATVRELIRAHRPLIVLDGVVNLPAARAFVDACCADLPVILTHAHRGQGPWESYPIEPLNPDDSEALLILTSGPEVDADVSEFNRLANVTGGYPLALAIAGHALAASGLSPGEFRDRLPEMPRGAVNRMLAVIMGAYRLLPSALQGTLFLLGTSFGAGVSEALLAEVAEAPVETLRPALRQLVRRGFASSYTVYGEPYYKAHALVRHFAKAFLRGKGQLDSLRARHLSGLLSYVKQQTRANERANHDRLAAEFGAMLAAARYAARHNRTDQLEELVLRLDPSGDDDFAARRGFQTELKWMWHLLDEPAAASVPLLAWAHEPVEEDVPEPALAAYAPREEAPVAEAPAQEEAPPVDAEAPVEETPAAPEPEPISAEQDTLPAGLDYSTDLEPLDEADAAIEDLTTALEQASEPIDEPLDETFDEPVELDEAPEPDLAEPVAEASVPPDSAPTPPSMPEETPAEPAPLSRADAARMRHMAQTAAEAHDTEHAIAYYAQALETYQANNDVSDELAALEALAALSLERSDYENVLNYVDRGMLLAEQLDDPQREGKLLMLLGDLQAELGRTEGAEVAFQEAIRALRPSEAWLEIGQTLDRLGALYIDTARPQDAIAVLEQAVPIFERVQRGDLLAEVLDKLGVAQAELLDWTAARRTYRRAVAVARASGDQRQFFEVLSRMGSVQEESGDYMGAQSAYRHALHVAFELNDQEAIGESLLALGRMLMNDTPQLNRVVQLLEEAAERLPDNVEARRLLTRAKTRQERLTNAGVTLMLPETDVRAYASASMDES